MTDWQQNLVEDQERIRRIASEAKRVAVLGIKPVTRAHKPAYYVPRYLSESGLEVIPVPVYYPELQEIFGRPVVRDLRDVPAPVDVVDVFRRPEQIDAHVDDLIALGPETVWLQAGIRNDGAAERMARAGIQVVQDRCLMVERRKARDG